MINSYAVERIAAALLIFSAGGFLTASAQTGFLLSERGLSFAAFEGGDSPAPRFFAVTSPRPVRLSLRSEGGAWLTLRPARAATPARIQVSANSSSLIAGTYGARVVVSAPGFPDQYVPVTLTVQAQPPRLESAPDVIRVTVPAGATDPVHESIFLRNSGGGGSISFRASIIDPIPGLSLLSESGRTVRDARATIGLKVDPNALEQAAYRGLIRIHSDAGSRDVAVAVLKGVSGPVLGLNLTGLRFEARQGNGHANTRNVLVLNQGSGSLDWEAEILAGGEWLSTGSGAARGTATLENAGRLSVSVNPGNLAPGSYYGLIRIYDAADRGGSLYLTTVLAVKPDTDPPSPDPSPQGLFFVGEGGEPAPPAQPIRLFLSSNVPAAYQASVTTFDGEDWLTAEPLSGVTSTGSPQVLTVTANAQNLTPGIYTGEVTVAFGSSEIRTTNVTLVVPPAQVSAEAHKGGRAAEGCTASKLSLTQTGLVNSFSAPTGWPSPLIVRLSDDCGEPVLDAQMIATFSNGDPALAMKLTNPRVGLYSATWVPVGLSDQVRVTAHAAAPNLGAAAAEIIGRVEANPAPVLFRNATLGNLNPVSGGSLAPGGVAQIFGSNLAPVTASAGPAPLPASVAGVEVLIGGYRAPVYFVSPEQINIQVPFELEANREHTLVVSNNGRFTLADSVNVTAVRPALFSDREGRVMAVKADGSLVTPASPARPGEEITIFLEGLGLTDPAVATGSPGPAEPPAEPLIRPTVTIDNQEADVIWNGLSPGVAGSYQIRFKIPSDAPDGELPMWVKQGEEASNAGVLPVSR